MKKVLKKKGIEDKAYDYKSLIILLVVFSITSFTGALLYKWLIPRIAILLLVCFAIVLKRKYFLDVYHRIKG